MDTNLAQPMILLLRMVFDIVLIFFLLRFFLQAARADFYNPITRAIVRLTDPLLNPLRTIIPGKGRQDWASLIAAVLLAFVFLLLALSLSGSRMPTILPLLWLAPVHVLEVVLDMIFWGTLVHAVLSWFPNAQSAPAAQLLDQLISPLLAPIRRVLPDLGGIDLSPLVLLLAAQMAKLILLPLLLGLAL